MVTRYGTAVAAFVKQAETNRRLHGRTKAERARRGRGQRAVSYASGCARRAR